LTREAAVDGAPQAVLFDRDGTLIHDDPTCTRDRSRVQVVAGARAAVQHLRGRGIAVGVVTNQAAIGRGQVRAEQVWAVNDVVDTLVGPFDTWQVCPHRPEDGCRSRKPAPGLVLAAAEHLGVKVDDVVVIGDIESDVLAARAAGATGILVPTPRTLREEVERSALVAPDLGAAVALALGAR
jgi:histidinol-phosphate phosphatase family protein